MPILHSHCVDPLKRTTEDKPHFMLRKWSFTLPFCLFVGIISSNSYAQDKPENSPEKQNEFVKFIAETANSDDKPILVSLEAERILKFIEGSPSIVEWDNNWTEHFIQYLRNGDGEYFKIADDVYLIHSYFINASLSGLFIVDMQAHKFEKLYSNYGLNILEKGVLTDGTGWIIATYGGLTRGRYISGYHLITYYSDAQRMRVFSTPLLDEITSHEHLCDPQIARIIDVAGKILGHSWKDIDHDGQSELVFVVKAKDCSAPKVDTRKHSRIFAISKGMVNEFKGGRIK